MDNVTHARQEEIFRFMLDIWNISWLKILLEVYSGTWSKLILVRISKSGCQWKGIP